MENYMRTNALKEPRPTDRKLDFGTYQAVVRAVNRLGIPLDLPPNETLIQLMELDEDILPYTDPIGDSDKPKIWGKEFPYPARKATPLYLKQNAYETDGHSIWDRVEAHQKVNVFNPYRGRWFFARERIPLLYMPQAVQWIPLSGGRDWAYAKGFVPPLSGLSWYPVVIYNWINYVWTPTPYRVLAHGHPILTDIPGGPLERWLRIRWEERTEPDFSPGIWYVDAVYKLEGQQ